MKKLLIASALLSILFIAAQQRPVKTEPISTETATTISSEDSTELYDLAWKQYRAGEYDKALKNINKAIQKNDSNVAYFQVKCYILIELKLNKEIIETATKGLEVDPDNADLYDIRGSTYYFEFQPEKALSDYRKMLDLEKGNARYYNNYLKLVNEQRNDAENKKVYAVFLNELKNGTDMKDKKFIGDVHFYAALPYTREDNWQKSIDILDEAIKMDKKQSAHTYYANRGVSYNMLHNYPKAIADLNLAVKIEPENPTYYSIRGGVFLNMKNYADAEKDFLKVLSLGGSGNNVYFNLAQAYLFQGKNQEAKQKYDLLLKTQKDDPTIYGNYAYALFEMGELENALKNFESALKLDPKEIDILLGLAVTNELLGNAEKAKEYLQKIKSDTEYSPDKNLLNKLMTEHYSYTDKFQKAWNDLIKKQK